ncbi:MAG: type II secretion system protein GspC [Aeromonas sp.]
MKPMLSNDKLMQLWAQCQRLPLTKLLQPLFWVLLLILAQQCASLTWHLIAMSTPAKPTIWVPALAQGQAGQPARLQLDKLNQLALFGNVEKKKVQKVDAQAATDAPQTRLKAELHGVLASTNPSKSIAIIAMSGKQASYGIDEVITGTQARIREMYSDRIIIDHAGRDETLMLDGEKYAKPQTKPSASKAAPKADKPSAENLDDYLTIAPAWVNGVIVGYRLNPGRNPALFEQIGLEPNDLAVRIDGLDLRDQKQAMQVMQQLTSKTELTVTVERQGQQLDLSISLSE